MERPGSSVMSSGTGLCPNWNGNLEDRDCSLFHSLNYGKYLEKGLHTLGT